MNVYLRNYESADGVYLTDCEPQHLDALIHDMENQGVYFNGSMWFHFDWQFVLDAAKAYVEIVISGDTE